MKSIQLLLKSCWSQKLYLFILILSSFLIQYSAFLYKSQVQNMLNSLSSSYFDIIYFGSIFLISIGVYTFLNSLIKIISEKLSLKMNLYCANIALNNINQKNADFFQEHHKNITTYIYDLMNISNLIKSIFNNFNIFMSIFGGLTFLLIKIHWIIGLFILLWFVIILYFAIHYQIHLIQSTKNFISERAKFTNHISESYKNYFTFIISSNHETNQKFFETNLDTLYAKANAQNNAKIKMEIILFIGIISLFTGFLLLAFFLKQSILGVGDLTMAVTQSIEIFLSFITFFRSIGESAEEYTRFNRSVENLIENKYIDSNKFIHQFSIKNITISSKDLNFIINEKEKKILLQEQTNVILSLLKVENNTQYNIYINQKNIKDITQTHPTNFPSPFRTYRKQFQAYPKHTPNPSPGLIAR